MMADLDFSSQAEPVAHDTLDFSAQAEPVRQVGGAENAGRQFVAGGGDLLKAIDFANQHLNPVAMVDTGISKLLGEPSADPLPALAVNAQTFGTLGPNEVADGLGSRIAGGAARAIPSLAGAIATGGESSFAGAIPEAVRAVPYLGRALTGIGAGAPTAAALTGEQTANLPDTMSATDKAEATAKSLGINLAMAGLPVAIGTNPALRAVTGGALGYGSSAAASAVQGQPQDQANNIVGGMMGALLGQHSGEVPGAPLDPYIARYNESAGEPAPPMQPEGPRALPAPDFSAEATPAAPAVAAPADFNPQMAAAGFRADPRTALAALDHPTLVQVAKDAGFDVKPGEGPASIIGKIVSQPTAFLHSDVLPEYMAAVTPADMGNPISSPAVASRPVETNPVVSQETPNPVGNVPPASLASAIAPGATVPVDSAGTAFTPQQGLTSLSDALAKRATGGEQLPAPVTTVDPAGVAKTSNDYLTLARQAMDQAQVAHEAEMQKRDMGLTPDIERTQAPKWEAARAKSQDIQDKLDTQPDDELATQRDDDSPPWWLAGQHAEDELAQQQAPGSRDLSTEVNAPKEPELPAAPYDMTPEELSAHADAVAGHGKAVEDAILGDKADEWRAAQRQFQSSNDAIADKGETTFKAIESKLSPKNRDLLYGIGESDQAHDDLQDFREAHQDAATAGTPEEATTVLSRFLPTLGNTKGGDPAQWTRKQQVAYAGMRTLREQIAENGWDSSAIQKNALHRAASRYSDSTDMEAMLDRFMKTEPRKPAQPATAALEAPAKESARIGSDSSNPAKVEQTVNDSDEGGVPTALRRPDWTPKVEKKALTEIDSLVEKFGGSTLADSIAQDFHEHQGAALIGKTIASHEDLAAMASVYRNPAFETMRYMYVDDAGTVLGETAVSSRMPSSATAFPTGEDDGAIWLIKAAPKGATGIWMVHNHPSGNPRPSNADLEVTGQLAIQLGDIPRAPKVKGHVVLDHDTFGRISPSGEDRGIGKLPDSGPDPLREKRGAELFDVRMSSPAFAASTGKQIAAMTPEDSSAVVVMAANGNVVSVHTFPNGVLTGPKGGALLARIGAKRGAVGLGIVTSSDNFAKYREAFTSASDRNLLYDAVVVTPSGHALQLGAHPDLMTNRSTFGKHSAAAVKRGDSGTRVYEPDAGAEPPPISLSMVKQALRNRGVSDDAINAMSRDDLRAEQANLRTRSEPTPEQQATGVKNATKEEERAMKGKAAVEHDLSTTNPEQYARAKAEFDADPHAGQILAARVISEKKAITPEESILLGLDAMRITNARQTAYEQAEKAMARGDTATRVAALSLTRQLDAQMEANDIAARYSGVRAGQVLQARKVMIQQDYSMSRLLLRAKVAKGTDLTDGERAKLEQAANEIAQRTKDLDAREAKLRQMEAEARPVVQKRAAKAKFDDLAAQLKAIAQKDQMKPGCVV